MRSFARLKSWIGGLTLGQTVIKLLVHVPRGIQSDQHVFAPPTSDCSEGRKGNRRARGGGEGEESSGEEKSPEETERSERERKMERGKRGRRVRRGKAM